ncbi:MAG: hypothetical protein J6W66_06095, partial [Lachnospiraceae bacterium]|nr:hypothetical protein [Lachnospiraceae bacterium]
SERIKLLLIVANEFLDEGEVTKEGIDVFIEMSEKLLGAKPGTMGFIRMLIGGGPHNERKE